MEDKIKVTDKRIFDSSGELREEFRNRTAESREVTEPVREAPEPPPEPEATADRPGSAGDRAAESPLPRPPGSERLPDPTFRDLVGLLAQPIAMFLGDARLPDGESAENLALARYHIDLLELLQAKTAGNVSPEDAKLLADLLYQLRLRYVEKAG